MDLNGPKWSELTRFKVKALLSGIVSTWTSLFSLVLAYMPKVLKRFESGWAYRLDMPPQTIDNPAHDALFVTC